MGTFSLGGQSSAAVMCHCWSFSALLASASSSSSNGHVSLENCRPNWDKKAENEWKRFTRGARVAHLSKPACLPARQSSIFQYTKYQRAKWKRKKGHKSSAFAYSTAKRQPPRCKWTKIIALSVKDIAISQRTEQKTRLTEDNVWQWPRCAPSLPPKRQSQIKTHTHRLQWAPPTDCSLSPTVDQHLNLLICKLHYFAKLTDWSPPEESKWWPQWWNIEGLVGHHQQHCSMSKRG